MSLALVPAAAPDAMANVVRGRINASRAAILAFREGMIAGHAGAASFVHPHPAAHRGFRLGISLARQALVFEATGPAGRRARRRPF